jgi:hypothetical protein
MNVSSLFVDNLRTGSIYSVNDIRTTEFSINSLGSYVYDVLNSSTIQGYAKLNSSNMFYFLPQSNQIPTLSNQLTTKGYVDSLTNSIETNNHTWSGSNTFSNSVSFMNGLVTAGTSLLISSSRQIGYTYYSEWLTDISSIVFDTPGVWHIHIQFEYSGEGTINQIECGAGTVYTETNTIVLETNNLIQRIVPHIFVNQSGNMQVNIVSNIQSSGNINMRYKYFYVRIA